MSKTITIRLENDIYDIFKKAAQGERRTISNFLEYAALAYLTNDIYVQDDEMNEIIKDKGLIKNIKKGIKDIENGKYKIVG